MSEEKNTIEIPEGTPTYTLPVVPMKPRPKEHTDMAKKIANRYLSIAVLEKLLQQKKQKKKEKLLKTKNARFKPPETPEEFYDRAEKYLAGAQCAVPFQEKSDYYRRCGEMFAGAGDYLDAPELAKQYTETAEQVLREGNEGAYAHAKELMDSAVSADDWFAAARAFERIVDYRDAEELAERCEQKLHKLDSFRLPMTAAVILLVLGLIIGVRCLTKTDTFKMAAAKGAYQVGMDTIAADLLKGMKNKDSGEELLHEIYYKSGVELMEQEKYSKALSKLKKCGDYLDSESLMQECQFALAMGYLENGKYQKAQQLFCELGDYGTAEEMLVTAELMQIEEAEVGDHVYFGDSEYILLDKQEDKALLLSCKLYGHKEGISYNETRSNVSWTDCTMRTILNTAYEEEHFSTREQELLMDTITSKGVTDQVFLLSVEEYNRYQPVMGKKDALWWLRDNGEEADTAVFVSDDGAVMEYGYPVDSTTIQGRPAFWVSR